MKLNREILLAVAAYYMGRFLQKASMARIASRDLAIAVGGNNMTPVKEEPYKWDKDACLQAIDKACTKANIGWSATSGHFWFSKGKKTRQMDEKSWPNFIEKKVA